MKSTMRVTLLFVVILLASNAKAEDITKSFSGILWGASAAAVNNLEQVRQDEDIRLYQRAGDFYTLGTLNLEKVLYAFYQDQYFAAYMPIQKKEDIQAALVTLNQRYGPARAQLRIDRNIYIWEYLDIKVKLKHYLETDQAKLAFYFTPLSAQVNTVRRSSTSVHIFKLDAESEEIDF